MRPALIVGGAMYVLFGSAAAAHAFLDEASPRVGSVVHAAPREITLRFTQEIEPAFSGATITDASGQRADEDKPSISGNVMRVPLRPVGAGRYRVTWRVLSVDTHTSEGSFSFTVDKQ